MKTLALSLLIPLLSGSCLAQQPDTIAPAPGTEEWYWQRAVKLYPDAEYKDTEFFKEMVKIAAWLGETKDPMLALPDKKLRIAQMTAAKLGISARVSQSPPRTVIVKPAVPVKDPGPQVNPPELMKLIEEAKAEAGGTKWVGNATKKLVYSGGKWAGKTEEYLIESCEAQCRRLHGGEPKYVKGAPAKNDAAKDAKVDELKKAVEDK